MKGIANGCMIFLSALFACVCVNAIAASPPIEFGTFTNQLLTAQKEGVIPWKSTDGSASTTLSRNEKGSYSRSGNIPLSIGGFISTAPNGDTTPSGWDVEFFGDKSGVQYIEFEGKGCDDDCSKGQLNVISSLTKAGLTAIPFCAFGPGSNDTTAFVVSSTGLPPLFLALSKSGGSGGISMSMTLFTQPKNRGSSVPTSQLEYQTTLCSILFEQNLGKDGSVYYAYDFLWKKLSH